MKHFLYLVFWYLKAKFFGKKNPLQVVLLISDACNLQCKHCYVVQKQQPHVKTAAQIEEEMRYAYAEGARFVDFEGGEPMMWRDGNLTVNDLIDIAKKIGYFSCTVTTNAQFPFEDCRADSIWVSLDGLGKHHDTVRGEGVFARLEQNLQSNTHPAISANMVIDSNNYTSVEETARYVQRHPHLKSVSFNFYTPDRLPDPLFLDWDKRRETIDLILRLKKEGLPIMNSVSGLKKMKDNRFKKACWITRFILPDGTRCERCPMEEIGACDFCGYCMAGEMSCVFHLRPDTLMAGMKLRI